MMWHYRQLSRIDFRVIPAIVALMVISVLTISSYSAHHMLDGSDNFLTPVAKNQLQWFVIGGVVFCFFAGFDYNKLREWTWMLYALMVISLIGLFFTDSIQRVHRWYRLPFINMSIQPSEYAKLVVVISLSWLMERRKMSTTSLSTVFFCCLIVGIPFLLILRQPDLGTALVLFPITVVMFYFGDLNAKVVKTLIVLSGITVLITAAIFLGVVSHEGLRPLATTVLKDYQFDRLDPNAHHQRAAATAIAIGSFSGVGWRKSEYTARGWLPTPYTDSVFPSFGEECGMVGLLILLALYYALIYFSFQVIVVAKDHFGRLLAAGICVYVSVHILMNIGMMSGLFPITGVPLLLVSYGGSSILSTMIALGILQSIYSRRFMF